MVNSFVFFRRGEEHSFILKPAISTWKKFISQDRAGAQSSQVALGNALKSSALSKLTDGKESPSNTDHYSIMVSCHCNASGTPCYLGFYSLFFVFESSQIG